MKKLAVIILAIALLMVPMSLSASAASSINTNTYEQAVLDALNEEVKFSSGKVFSVPDDYINQAENFLKTIDMTETASKTILDKIADSKQLIIENEFDSTSDLEILPIAVKQQILDNGKDAAAAVGAVLVYDGDHVVVTYGNDTVFNDDPIIKVTGAETDYTAIILSVAGLVAVLVAVAAVASRKGLLAK